MWHGETTMPLGTVMTGLVPVIHVLLRHEQDVDRRDKPGDDERRIDESRMR
jgi:hypothetical protein